MPTLRAGAPLLALSLGCLSLSCSSARSPAAPGSEACLANVRERAGLVDWTARSEAVLVGRVDKADSPSRVTVRVEQQWAGRPVENPFALEIGPGDPPTRQGSSWVLFLRRRAGGGYERLTETQSLPLEVKEQQALDTPIAELHAEVVNALGVGGAIEAELRRVARGAPAAQPMRIEYREAKGDRYERWVYAENTLVRCGDRGALERRPLTPDDSRRFAAELAETRFWTTSAGAPLPPQAPARDLDLAVEMGGVILTFHEEAAAGPPVVPVIRVFESRLAPPQASPGAAGAGAPKGAGGGL